MSTQTATAAKKEKVRYLKIEEMSPADKEAFDKLPEAKRAEYMGRLAKQDAEDMIAAARDKQAKEREEKRAASDKEKAIKDIIKEVKEGTLEATPEAIHPRFAAMTPPLPTEEYEKTLERIKTDSVKRSTGSSLPAKPAYELTHELKLVKKADFDNPGVSTAPDNTLSNSTRRYGMIAPILARVGESGKLVVMDGKRRLALAGDEDNIPVVVVSGFPDEDTAERAEVTVNRVRSLNILSVANALTRMRTRGVADTEIRRDMGFKTGEIDKITSIVTSLVPALSEALTAGNITASVALSIAKLPKGLQNELAKTYADKVKANPSQARISEADVEAVRQKRAADAAKRDTPTLGGLSGAVSGSDATGLDKGKGGKVDSSKSAPGKQAGKAK
jgi:ParB-like chromosome segregation protein Spo0J